MLDVNSLIINLGAKPETKAAIEEIVGATLTSLGALHASTEDGSVDRMLVEVCGATMRRTLSPASIEQMESRIKDRMREKA